MAELKESQVFIQAICGSLQILQLDRNYYDYDRNISNPRQ